MWPASLPTVVDEETKAARTAIVGEILDALGHDFGPHCLGNCDLYKLCRERNAGRIVLVDRALVRTAGPELPTFAQVVSVAQRPQDAPAGAAAPAAALGRAGTGRPGRQDLRRIRHRIDGCIMSEAVFAKTFDLLRVSEAVVAHQPTSATRWRHRDTGIFVPPTAADPALFLGVVTFQAEPSHPGAYLWGPMDPETGDVDLHVDVVDHPLDRVASFAPPCRCAVPSPTISRDPTSTARLTGRQSKPET